MGGILQVPIPDDTWFHAQVYQERRLGHQIPRPSWPPAAGRKALCNSQWDSCSATPDPDVVAAGSSFRPPSTTMQRDIQAVWSAARVCCQTCVMHARMTPLMAQATQADRIFLELRRILGAGAWLVGGPLPSSTGVPTLPETGHVLDLFLRPRGGLPMRMGSQPPNTTRSPTSSTKPPKKQASTYRKKKQAPPAPPSQSRRSHCVDPPRKSLDPRSLGLRGHLLPSPSFQKRWQGDCIHPEPDRTRRSTTRPTDAISTASVSHPWFLTAHRGRVVPLRTTLTLVTWISQASILNLAQRISSSLHRDSARVILRTRSLGCHEGFSSFTWDGRLVARLG